MNQNLNFEPTNPSRKQVLEADIQERTLKYLSLDNLKYDEELMKAHLELAGIYETESNLEQSYSHFRVAENEFLKMCKLKTELPKYITEDFDFQALRKRNEETENELNHYKKEFLKIARRISYDAMNLLHAQTSVEPKKNLVGLIRSMRG